MHKAPAAFVLVLLLRISGFRNIVVLSCLLLFACMSPLGAGMTKWLDSMNLLDVRAMKIIVAVVIGSFLHISTTILFEIETPGNHKISLKKLVVIGFGLLAAMATIL
jgi:hypothetical protein